MEISGDIAQPLSLFSPHPHLPFPRKQHSHLECHFFWIHSLFFKKKKSFEILMEFNPHPAFLSAKFKTKTDLKHLTCSEAVREQRG